MRRVIAFLALCAFANLSFAQVPGACLLSPADNVTAGTQDAAGAHDGHHQPVTDGQAVGQSSGDDEPHPGCLMAGPCGMSIDAARQAGIGAPPAHTEQVAAVSDDVPSSRATSPDIPPPRLTTR